MAIFTAMVVASAGVAQPGAVPAPVDPPALPADPPADKSRYTLFDPTPRAALREFQPDRPDVTEGPFTVDAGHVQFEAGLAQYAFDRDAGTRTHTLDIAPFNVKLGLTNSVDVEFVFTPFERIVTRDASRRDAVQGVGDDTEVRVKWNLWGNDADTERGKTAFALLPFVKLPTATDGIGNHHVEGGLILPLSIALPAGFDLGTMAEFDVTYDGDRDDYGIDFVHSASLGHTLVGELEGYVEYIGTAPRPGGGGYRAEASSGLVYGLADNWKIDAGGTVGLSGETDDVTLFVGTSVRF